MGKVRRRRRWSALAVALAVALTIPATAAARSPEADRTVTVMTQNLYLGGSLDPALAVLQDPGAGLPEFLGAVTTVYLEAQASDFAGRMAAVADQVAAHEPLLIGLQEATRWVTFTESGPVVDDLVALLVGALETEHGLHYEVVATAPGFQFGLPPTLPGVPVFSVDISDVILARADLPTSQLKLSNARTGSYQTVVELPNPLGGDPIPFSRQWASVDAKVRGKSFRFVTTHLESFSPPAFPPFFRASQAAELLGGNSQWDSPLATDLPLVLVGDFNSQPGEAGDGAQILIDAAALTDAWTAAGDGAGATCCQESDLRNDASVLSTRIDLVLARGALDIVGADRTGEEAADKTSSGLWPSDHAGVTATVVLRPKP